MGGLDPILGDFAAVVSLDLRRLDALHWLDERGFSLGHFPRSFCYATIYGFAATRSSGQDSAGYGRFDDMVRGLRAVTPAGSGRDRAREYRLPAGAPEAAADVIADGHTETVDLGRIDDAAGGQKWFGTVMAAGFDSLVSDRTNRMRWPHGRMRYNVAMVHSASRIRLVRLFPTVFRGTHVELDDVSTARTRVVEVHCPGINAYADGDFACPLPVTVSAVPGALQILTPITR